MANAVITGYTLSPLQKRNWLRVKTGFDFNNLIRVQIQGILDTEKLRYALQKVVDRHEVFRTSYYNSSDLFYPVQIIHEPYSPVLNEEDISDRDEEKQASRVSEIEGELVAFSFRLDQHELLKSHLVKLSGDNHFLYLYTPCMASDPATLYNVARECAAYYQEDFTGADEPDESLQFVQYSQWQNEILEENEQEGINYWKNKISNYSRSQKLPLSIFNSRNISEAPRLSELKLRDHLCGRIKAHCKKTGKNVSDFVLSCWVALLWNYLDKPGHFVVGKVESGRTFDAFKKISGLMARTLPFRISLNENETQKALLAKVEEETEDILRWQDNYDPTPVGYDDLDLLEFQLAFECIDVQNEVIQSERTSFTLQSVHSNADSFQLKLVVLDYSDHVELKIHYHPANYNEASVECLGDQLTQVLRNAISQPESRVSELVSITPKEQERISKEFNRTTIQYNRATYIEEFERQAAIVPNKNAVVFGDTTLSYVALNRYANQFANFLVGRYNVKAGDVVAVLMKRSANMIIALLGIMKAGATYLPIDRNAPEARVRYILDDSAARVIVVDSRLAEVDSQTTPVVLFDEHFDISEYSIEACPRVDDPESVVYIIYTSGSTGKPKGTLVRNCSLVNYVNWFRNAFQIYKDDRTLLFSSIAFDLCYTSLWPSLAAGGTLYMLEESSLLEPEKLIHALKKYKITFIKLTPTHFKFITEAPTFPQDVHEYALRLIVLGGEHINMADVERYWLHRENIRFVNHYGPTETTVGVIATEIKNRDLPRFKTATIIGRPIHNNRVFIVGENGQQSPIGMCGEICISGEGVSAGYLNNDEMTQKKFVANPFELDDILYKTGDLGRWLPDGMIQLAGRNDFQVKLRGYRVELGEIERVLMAIDGVRNAVVLALADPTGETELRAYLECDVTEQIIREALQKQLPEYMIPAKILNVENFPLLQNGKVDRKTLAEYSVNETELSYEPPRNDVEKKIAEAWEKILMRSNISTNVNFFNVGGNSLKLVKVFRELAVIFPERLTLADLFKYTTISAIASFLDAPQSSEAIESLEF